jgi:uncharacterized protein YndB with AHSA1/START domain
VTTRTAETAVQTSIVVDAPTQLAFDVFTQDMASWWSPDHHIIEAELAEMVFELREGGRVYDVGVDGSECQWARVLAFEPPERLAISWDITPQWRLQTDLAKTSEVEVRFIPDGPERTRVELEHRHLDRHGDGWQGMRDAVGSLGGWNGGLQRYAQYLRDVVRAS